MRIDRHAARRAARTRPPCYPGHMGITTLGRERAHNPFLHQLARERADPGAARHVRRAARATRCARDALEETARADPRARRLPADRDADVRGDRAVRARRRRVDRRRPEGDVHASTTAAGARSRCGPRAPRRSCRAYLEHGMHKLPQPVKLWYLSSFFRHERPQAGPLPPVLAGRRRGDRLRRPGRRRRGRSCCSPSCSRRSACAACGCGSASLGTPATRARLPRASCRRYLRAHEDRAVARRCVERIDLNPLRAFDSDHPGTREVMAERAAAARPRSTDDDAEHFAAVRALLDAAGRRLRGRHDARARARLLHAHGVRVHVATRSARRAASAAAAATTG